MSPYADLLKWVLVHYHAILEVPSWNGPESSRVVEAMDKDLNALHEKWRGHV